ncbi:terminase small subunit [Segnochrobactraceae bacterium EtOH-i3]
MSLTPKQARFVEEFVVDLNATQAAIRAGYSAKTAADIGRQLLRKTPVARAISERQRAISERIGVTAERVVEELAKIGFANMADYMKVGEDGDPYLDFSGLTRDQAAALSEVTVEDFKDGRGEDARDVRRIKFKLYDKRAALVDLGKHLGMFKEKVEVSGPDGGPIQTEATFDVSRLSTEALREVLAAMEATDNSMNDDG